MGAPVDLVGSVFGRLTVVAKASNNEHNQRRWLCSCACGCEVVVVGGSLRTGNTTSCGCLRSEMVAAKNMTHGMSDTPEYHVWASMVQRCTNPNDKAWENYGGRGITVSSEWLNFEAFISDMGPCPVGLTLERKDNEGGYSTTNCKWATRHEQAMNKRPKKKVA